ncbi:MAG: efflux RND transporter periplasmic adaptor subunit [Chloroflexi bacterium]|nr:efflux RND transporter periplasmic adaptor subunit [Chloroflexota bacterium]
MFTLTDMVMKVAIVLSLALTGCQGNDTGHVDSSEDEAAKGPHGGRLLTEGSFQTEVTIFERGVPPQFRIYFFEDGKSVEPNRVSLSIELYRFGGRTDVIGFETQGDYLLGDQVIEEPHSFDVIVTADYQGKKHRWKYDSYEGRTEISDEAVRNSGIGVEPVGSATIREVIRVFGRIRMNEDRLKKVSPRFSGVVTETRKRLGETVTENEVMAVVESNESLRPFEVRSGITGTVIRKDVTAGEFADEGAAIYTVADLSLVWVDFNVPRKDFDRLKLGQTVTVSDGEGTTRVRGRIDYISPFGALDTQTMLARVELQNLNGHWRPGFFVVGEIVVGETRVPLAVKADALQVFRDWDVVFARAGNLFEIAILELGRRDDDWVEVVSGLEPGQSYATENSFIIKADIGKFGATHDH